MAVHTLIAVALSQETLEYAEKARAYVASRSPEENRRAAALLRELVPRLTKRQRATAEDMAVRFEERAK